MLPMLARAPNAEARRRACDLLTALDVQHRAAAMPAQLSGGEQLRVAIAGGPTNEPQVIVDDEPTARLESVRDGVTHEGVGGGIPCRSALVGATSVAMLFLTVEAKRIAAEVAPTKSEHSGAGPQAGYAVPAVAAIHSNLVRCTTARTLLDAVKFSKFLPPPWRRAPTTATGLGRWRASCPD